MVSVAVSKLAETDLVFVQSDAKTNSVYYCENVLEQGLLPAICCIEQQLRGLPGKSACTLSLRPIPAYTDIHGLCNAPSVYCMRRIRNVTVTVPMCMGSLNHKTGRQTVRI